MIAERRRAAALIPHALYWASTFYPLFIAAQLWVRVLSAYLQEWLWGAATSHPAGCLLHYGGLSRRLGDWRPRPRATGAGGRRHCSARAHGLPGEARPGSIWKIARIDRINPQQRVAFRGALLQQANIAWSHSGSARSRASGSRDEMGRGDATRPVLGACSRHSGRSRLGGRAACAPAFRLESALVRNCGHRAVARAGSIGAIPRDPDGEASPVALGRHWCARFARHLRGAR